MYSGTDEPTEFAAFFIMKNVDEATKLRAKHSVANPPKMSKNEPAEKGTSKVRVREATMPKSL